MTTPNLRVTVSIRTDTQHTKTSTWSDLNRDHLPVMLAECIAGVAEAHRDSYLTAFAEAVCRVAREGRNGGHPAA